MPRSYPPSGEKRALPPNVIRVACLGYSRAGAGPMTSPTTEVKWPGRLSPATEGFLRRGGGGRFIGNEAGASQPARRWLAVMWRAGTADCRSRRLSITAASTPRLGRAQATLRDRVRSGRKAICARAATMSAVSVPAPASVRIGSERANGLVDRVIPRSSQRSLTLPGLDRLLELRWAARIRRAPVMTPEQHAAAVADPAAAAPISSSPPLPAVRRRAPTGVAARPRSQAQGAALGLPRRPLRRVRLAVPASGHPP